MDPSVLGPSHWDQIGRAVTNLFLFVGLALNCALSFLLGHAIIPSLVGDDVEAAGRLRGIRRLLYVVAAASLALMLYALVRALSSAVDVLQRVYPRFGV
jgi:hypothetical protein